MSLLDQLKALEADVAKRLRELEPAVAEHKELSAVAERLGIKLKAGEVKTTAPNTHATRSTRRRRTSAAASAKKRAGESRGRPSKRSDEIVKLIAANPGITVAELGKRLKVDPTGLYRPVHRLEQEGRLRKTGTKLEPTKN
jgi:DNA invertase Pin-like site-specific DNA recombinase